MNAQSEKDRLRVVAAMNKQREKLKADRAVEVEAVKTKDAEKVKRIRQSVITHRRQVRYEVGIRPHKRSIVLKQIVKK